MLSHLNGFLSDALDINSRDHIRSKRPESLQVAINDDSMKNLQIGNQHFENFWIWKLVKWFETTVAISKHCGYLDHPSAKDFLKQTWFSLVTVSWINNDTLI